MRYFWNPCCRWDEVSSAEQLGQNWASMHGCGDNGQIVLFFNGNNIVEITRHVSLPNGSRFIPEVTPASPTPGPGSPHFLNCAIAPVITTGIPDMHASMTHTYTWPIAIPLVYTGQSLNVAVTPLRPGFSFEHSPQYIVPCHTVYCRHIFRLHIGPWVMQKIFMR